MERAWNNRDLGFVVDVRPVAGTSLVLIHCCLKKPGYKQRGLGARFALLDADFVPVWSLDADYDYATLAFQQPFSATGVRNYFREHPAIQVTDSPGRFVVRLAAENEEVSFSVAIANARYKVTELARVGIPSP